MKARASHIFQNPGIDTECSFNKIFLITAVFSGTYVEIESIQNSTQTLWSRKITLIYIEHEASCRHTKEYYKGWEGRGENFKLQPHVQTSIAIYRLF